MSQRATPQKTPASTRAGREGQRRPAEGQRRAAAPGPLRRGLGAVAARPRAGRGSPRGLGAPGRRPLCPAEAQTRVREFSFRQNGFSPHLYFLIAGVTRHEASTRPPRSRQKPSGGGAGRGRGARGGRSGTSRTAASGRRGPGSRPGSRCASGRKDPGPGAGRRLEAPSQIYGRGDGLPSPTMGPGDIKQKIDGRGAKSNLHPPRRLYPLFEEGAAGRDAGRGRREPVPSRRASGPRARGFPPSSAPSAARDGGGGGRGAPGPSPRPPPPPRSAPQSLPVRRAPGLSPAPQRRGLPPSGEELPAPTRGPSPRPSKWEKSK